MMNFRKRNRLGFTLIELAIVLSVVGLMTVGLWRLMSSSNQQLKDTAAAGQIQQLIGAASAFLTTSDGQAFMEAPCGGGCASGKTISLPLPASAAGGAACYA